MGSKSNIIFGEEMSWLLGKYWEERWIDKELTFCNLDDHDKNIEENFVQKHSVESFLQFTKVIILLILLKESTDITFRKPLPLVPSFATVKLLMKQSSLARKTCPGTK